MLNSSQVEVVAEVGVELGKMHMQAFPILYERVCRNVMTRCSVHNIVSEA